MSGCYALHAARGQLAIWWGREPIEDVLARPALDPKLRSRLELVLAVRRYAIEEIGLAESGSYTCYYETPGEYVAWNVSAAAPDALAPYGWTFPFLGTLPYIGFFARGPAEDELRRVSALGLDGLLLPVPAYSTLGWFDDPVFSSMAREDEATLVETIIHELAHATVWVDGDAELNENLASFVGEQGAQDFFRARAGEADPGLAEAARRARDGALVNAALGGLRDELSRIYEASGSRARKLELKQETFRRFRARFRDEVQPRLEGSDYEWVGEERVPFNNALVLAFARYHAEGDLFEALFAQHGGDLAATVRALKGLEDEDDPRAALRAWVADTVGK